MMLNIYAVYDKKANSYGNPFTEHSDAAAIRGMTEVVMSEGKSMLHQYPEDFDLYRIGVYSSEKGLIAALESNVHLVNAGQLMIAEMRRQNDRARAANTTTASLLGSHIDDTVEKLAKKMDMKGEQK